MKEIDRYSYLKGKEDALNELFNEIKEEMNKHNDNSFESCVFNGGLLRALVMCEKSWRSAKDETDN